MSLMTCHIDIAPTADLTSSPLSWEWETLGSFTHGGVTRQRVKQSSDVSFAAGRAADSAVASPAAVSLVVDNADEAFTLGNPMGRWYGDLRLGTPLRVRVPGPDVALVLDGDTAHNISTPDHSSLDITGDIDLRFEGDIDWWRGSPAGIGGSALVGKYKSSTNQRSYLLWMAAGRLIITWSAAGTSGTTAQLFSSVLVPWARGRHAVRASLDVNNGAAGRTARFYVADSLAGPWTLLDEKIEAGTTSIFSSTAPAEVGVVTGDATSPPTGRVFAAQIYADLTGSDLRANPDFEAQSSGTTQFTDSAGRTWTTQGDAQITSDRVRRIFRLSRIAPYFEQDDEVRVARAEVDADGVLRLMGQGESPLASVLYRAETDPSVDLLAGWPMEDDDGATTFAPIGTGVAPMFFGGSVRPAADSSLPASQPLPSVTANEGVGYRGVVPTRTGLTNYRLTAFVKVPTLSTNGAQEILAIRTTGTVRKWSFILNDATVSLIGRDVDDTVVVDSGAGGATGWDDWVQVTLGLTQNGGNVDWAYAWLTIGGDVFGGASSVAGTLGRPTEVGGLFEAATGGVSLGHVTVTTDTVAGWLGWHDGANNAYTGETAGTRILRLCAEEGVSLRIIGDSTATGRMGPQSPDTLLNLLGECAKADGGILSEDAETLGLVYRTRKSMLNQEPVLTLDRATRGLIAPFAPVSDDQLRRTQFTASRRDGTSAAYVSPDWDPDRDPAYPDSDSFNVESDLQLPDLAARAVHRGTVGPQRLPTLATNLIISARNPTEQAAIAERLSAWLSLDVGDLVRVTNQPGDWSPDIDLIVDQIVDDIGTDHWRGQLNCSPGEPWTHAVRDDPTRGVRVAVNAVTTAPFTTGTSTSMTVTSDVLWTTDAAYFPLDIAVSGARLRVTAISGASSPQTFTVSSTVVNGVEKLIPAGTSVDVWIPAVRGGS